MPALLTRISTPAPPCFSFTSSNISQYYVPPQDLPDTVRLEVQSDFVLVQWRGFAGLILVEHVNARYAPAEAGFEAHA